MHKAVHQHLRFNKACSNIVQRMQHTAATSLLQQKLLEKGLDICHPCNVSWYNRAVGEELALPFEGHLAVLVGNSKALWKPMLLHYKRNPVVTNPVDAYTAAAIRTSLAEADLEARDIYEAKDTSAGRLVAFQRLAHATGLAFYDQESFLCVHPQFGPWFALRALVILPEESTLPEPNLLPDPATPEVHQGVMEAFKAALASSDRFAPWVRLRDAVAPNHPMRYSDEQIRYHYLKRLSDFQAAVENEEKHDTL